MLQSKEQLIRVESYINAIIRTCKALRSKVTAAQARSRASKAVTLHGDVSDHKGDLVPSRSIYWPASGKVWTIVIWVAGRTKET